MWSVAGCIEETSPWSHTGQGGKQLIYFVTLTYGSSLGVPGCCLLAALLYRAVVGLASCHESLHGCTSAVGASPQRYMNVKAGAAMSGSVASTLGRMGGAL